MAKSGFGSPPPPPAPANDEEKAEYAARQKEIKESREVQTRLLAHETREREATDRGLPYFPNRYVVIDDQTGKSALQYLEDIQKAAADHEVSFDPTAMGGMVISTGGKRPYLQAAFKGPHTFIKVKDFSPGKMEKLKELEAVTKSGGPGAHAAQKELSKMLGRFPHYHIDENGRITKIPPPDVHLRWKGPFEVLNEVSEFFGGKDILPKGMLDFVAEKISGRPTSHYFSEASGKQQTWAAMAVYAVVVVLALPAVPAMMPFLHLFAGNSYRAIIEGHRDVMRIKKELEGVTVIGIDWDGKPHKEVLKGMLLEMEKEGMTLDPNKCGKHVLAFMEGREFITEKGEVWPAASTQDVEWFRLQIEKLKGNQAKTKLLTDTRDQPVFAADKKALESKEKLETEFQSQLQTSGNETAHGDDPTKDHAKDALLAKYNDILSNDTKTTTLSEDASAVAKRAAFLAETETQLAESSKSFDYLADHPSYSDAPPLDSRYKSLGQKVRDTFLDTAEKVKDPVQALEILEKRFSVSATEMGALLAAREAEINDLSRRNEALSSALNKHKIDLPEAIKVDKSKLELFEKQLKGQKEELEAATTKEDKKEKKKEVAETEKKVKDFQEKVGKLEAQVGKVDEALAVVAKTKQELDQQAEANKPIATFLQQFPDKLKAEIKQQQQLRDNKTVQRHQ